MAELVNHGGNNEVFPKEADPNHHHEIVGSILASYISGLYKLSMWIPSDLGEKLIF